MMLNTLYVKRVKYCTIILIKTFKTVVAVFCVFLQNNEPFIDDSFPPIDKSLYYNPNEPQEGRK